MKHFFLILASGICIIYMPFLYAEEQKTNTAIGFTFDLLPITISAAAGKAGYSYQTWIGINHLRFRIVGAQVYMPDSLTDSRMFKDRSMTVTAAIIDYTFGNNFNGLWVGSGFEIWQNRISHKHSGDSSFWINQVLSFGGGYILPISGNFYIEPWAAMHWIMNDRNIISNGDTYRPQRFSAEVSVKAGYFFNL